ncbi:MAG: anaerobic ribonucleoside-triphosphate reductase activating protein [Candidatus Hermodarchaeia archaeon]
MKAYIAGKPLLSTTDWPSSVCCVVFFTGCNLRCRFCFNGPLLEFDDQYLVDLERVFEELEWHQYLIDGILVTGGEPTLQPDALHAIGEWTHSHNLKFGIMTNGTKPIVLQQLLDTNLLDYVAVDVKTTPNQKEYAHITQTDQELLPAINETIALLRSSKISYEFRTTLVPSFIDKISQLEQILKWIGKKHYVLQNFRATDTVLDPNLKTTFSVEALDQFRQFAKKKRIITRF